MRNWPIHLRWPSNGQVSVLSCSHKSDQFAHCQKDGSVCGLGRNSEPRTWDREQATVDISSFCATMRLAAPYSSARHLIPSSRVHPIPGSQFRFSKPTDVYELVLDYSGNNLVTGWPPLLIPRDQYPFANRLTCRRSRMGGASQMWSRYCPTLLFFLNRLARRLLCFGAILIFRNTWLSSSNVPTPLRRRSICHRRDMQLQSQSTGKG